MTLTRETRVLFALVLIGPMPLLWLIVKRIDPNLLRKLQPWAAPAVLVTWFASLAVFVSRDWASWAAIVAMIHGNFQTFYRWIKARAEFQDSDTPESRKMARLVHLRGRTYIGVKDSSSSEMWYTERLGFRRLIERPDPEKKIVRLKFGEKDTGYLTLGPPYQFSSPPRAVLFSRKLAKAREEIASRGVNVSLIERDCQGTEYFEFSDPEGNTIEICNNRS